MKEIFTILQDSYSIAGISIDELNKLFLHDDHSTYTVSMIGKDKIILKNKDENKFEKLECICNYFDVETNDCLTLSGQVTGKTSCDSCKECFKCALRKLEAGEMSLK